MTIPNSIEKHHVVNGGDDISLITGEDIYQPLSETAFAWRVLKDELNKLDSLAGKSFADFGAGSGQFAVWTKANFPDLAVTAYEIDPNAEKYIDANILHVGLAPGDVEVVIDDIANITGTDLFDAVISTPPFVADSVKKLAINYPHEGDPEATVFGGYKGLEFHPAFLRKAFDTLKPGGFVVTVSARSQKNDIAEILDAIGFTTITYSEDENASELLPLVDAGFTLAFKPE